MRQILTMTFLYSTLLSFGQSFEGTLTYVADIEVAEKLAKMGMTKQVLLDKMKSEGSWSDTVRISYKRGNYYMLLNNNPKSWSIYKAETNKIYAMQDGDASDICTVTDASIDLEYTLTGKMPTVENLDTSVIVNGFSCGVVRVNWNSGTYDYYYNKSEFVVDASFFSKHIYDGLANFLKISNSLPVKIVKTANGIMTMTMTLVSSKNDVVDDKIFEIPQLLSDKDLNMVKLPNRELMRIKK